MDLTALLTQNLGITDQQAQGGAGLIFKMAQSALGAGDFQKLASAVPGIDGMLKQAPDAGGGLMGAVGGLLGGLGGGASQLGNMAQLAEGFSKLKLSPEMVSRFVPMIMQFLQQQNGGAELKTLLDRVLKA